LVGRGVDVLTKDETKRKLDRAVAALRDASRIARLAVTAFVFGDTELATIHVETTRRLVGEAEEALREVEKRLKGGSQ
jgi:hypothetical protein